jgi:phage terminase large subunit
MSDLRFNKHFREVNETKQRYRVLLGSAGSGKSVNVAQDYILKLSNPLYAGANLMVVRATESSHKDSTFSELVGAINRAELTDYWTIRTSPMYLESKITGNSVIFRGCNDVRALERIKSVTVKKGKLTWIWAEEATELKSSDFEILDDRLRGELPNEELYYQITLTFNPINAQHWIKLNLWDSQDPKVFTHKSTYIHNRYIDEAYKERMERRRLTDPEGYRVYGLGEWGNTEGNILSNYELGDCDNNYNHYDSVVMAQDFGFNHANALIVVGYKDDVMYIIKELYQYGKYTTQLIEMADRMLLPDSIMYCDSAEPDRIKEWRNAGYRAYPVVKDKGCIKAQIDYLKQHRIVIDPSCVNTYKEIQQWRWKKDATSGQYLDEPLEVNDDAMAALRYATEPFRRNRRMRTMSKHQLGL